jgi:nickel/cobalt exporter
VELAPGTLVAPVFLDILDPDRNRRFEEAGITAFAAHVAANMEVRLNEARQRLTSRQSKICSLEDLITGIGTLYLDYSLPIPPDMSEPYALFYQNRLEHTIALYSLHIAGNPEHGVRIVSEERDEILQDRVSVLYNLGEPPIAVDNAFNAADAEEIATFSVPGVKTVIQRLRDGAFSANVIAILTGLAFLVGILHAFTPGHGKALVGAYLVANRGSVLQAAVLGIVVTLTHTMSIYVFGALSSTATYVFMPARVIPVMVLISGLLIVGIGMWSFIRRLLGLEVDHAHLLPNLSVLQAKGVNILLDGSAAESAELLAIVSDDDEVLAALRDAGADDINICSPGCETHNRSSLRKAERQSLQLIKKAVETGAVDAVVTGNVKKRRTIETYFQPGNGMVFAPPESLETARDILVGAARLFAGRGPVTMPELKFSWKRLVSLGFAGGIVPCPDALAILLVSIAMRQLLLGMGIVLSFSIGLSLALVSIGITIVLSGKVLSRSGLFGALAARVPYATSLFLAVLGMYMIVKILPQI